MSAEEETAMKIEQPEPEPETSKENTAASGTGNENFVVLDMAGDSEDSDKEGGKEGKERPPKAPDSDSGGTNKGPPSADGTSKPAGGAPRMRKKPKAPVVDVNSLRKRKWQLKVYPLHADDLKLNYCSILCKLASESLLYIPSEGRHGKAELYVATQKETAAIIGKLLRMPFHHQLLSIEVVRKDTGGKEDGDESKKECKAFLMFDKFLSKKIFDAKGEKGRLIEKTVTLNKLPKAATKDFIRALFPFATEIEIIESDDPDERKATVICKTPVTSLLVYKSFKRLEINDVHVKLSVDDSVKTIRLPPAFFLPPPEKKDNGPPEQSTSSLSQNPVPPKRPLMTPLTRRAQIIKKRALLARKKPTRAQVMRANRLGTTVEEVMEEMPPRLGGRNSMPRRGLGPEPVKARLGGGRDLGPRRRMGDRPGDRRNRDRDSMERRGRRGSREGSQMTKEMLQLQNQLNQAIKNQIAMLSTAQGGGGGAIRGGGGLSGPSDSYRMGGGSSQRTSLLGQGPRHFGSDSGLGLGPRGMDQYESGPWSMERSGHRQESRSSGGDRSLPRPDRSGGRPDRGDRMDRPGRMDSRGSRDRGADRSERSSGPSELGRQTGRSGQRQSSTYGSGDSAGSRPPKGERSHSNTGGIGNSHTVESTRGTSRSGRGGPEFGGSARSSQRTEGSFGSQGASSGRYGDYPGQSQGENGAYYRRY